MSLPRYKTRTRSDIKAPLVHLQFVSLWMRQWVIGPSHPTSPSGYAITHSNESLCLKWMHDWLTAWQILLCCRIHTCTNYFKLFPYKVASCVINLAYVVNRGLGQPFLNIKPYHLEYMWPWFYVHEATVYLIDISILHTINKQTVVCLKWSHLNLRRCGFGHKFNGIQLFWIAYYSVANSAWRFWCLTFLLCLCVCHCYYIIINDTFFVPISLDNQV